MNKFLIILFRLRKKRLASFGNLSVVFFMGLFVFVVGCKSAEKAQGSKPLKERSSAYLLKKLDSHHLDVEWLSAKAKISFRGNSQSKKATSYLRLRKDSVIWVNVKKLGIEAARILITPDSIYILDRINKEYAVQDFSFIEQEYHLPANFAALQNLVLGNPLFFSEAVLSAEIQKERYHLASDNDQSITSDYWLNGSGYTLEKMLFLDLRYNRKVAISQSNYQSLDSYQNFSYLRSLDLSSPETGDLVIELKLSDVTINVPKNIRFEIPEHYTKID